MKRVSDDLINEAAKSYKVVRHRTDKAQKAIDQIHEGVNQISDELDVLNDDLDALLSQVDALLDGDFDFTEEDQANADQMLKEIEEGYVPETRYQYEKLGTLNADRSWEELMSNVMAYAEDNDIDLSGDPFDGLLTQAERDRIGQKIIEDYKVDMDPDERAGAINSYLSYGLMLVSFLVGTSRDQKEQLNRLCEITNDLLNRHVNIDPKYNHNEFMKKPDNLNAWFVYFMKYYPSIADKTGLASDVLKDGPKSNDDLNDALEALAKQSSWIGMLFSMIFQFNRKVECGDTDKVLFILDAEDGPELVGNTTEGKLIAGFVNWIDTLCKESKEYKHSSIGENSDIRDLVMALLARCGFGESDQDGMVKTIQEFAIDVYNTMTPDQKTIDENTIQIGICNYIMTFLNAIQKRAEGMPFMEAALQTEEVFVNRCQIVGYGMISILKKSATFIGKADVVSPVFILIHSVDVDEWAEFTYQCLFRARTVYLGYYIDLEKMDEDLENEWRRLRDNGITISRRQH